ncbi:MAG: hypothetical protein LBM13_00345, partial [Candidatus Ancillula sp.]|nr:hypothetical protein [Candidatus Ancillula sp.]
MNLKIIKLKNKQKKSTISKFDKIEKEIQKIEIKLKSGEILLSNKFKDQKFLNQKFQAQSEKHSFSKEIDYLISLSASTGIPLLTTLKGVKKIIKQMKIVQSEIQTLLAMPKMTIKILRLLPLFTLAISFFLGINSVKFLFLSNLGYVCLLGGIIFYLFGELITKNFLDKFNSNLESKNILSVSGIQIHIILS